MKSLLLLLLLISTANIAFSQENRLNNQRRLPDWKNHKLLNDPLHKLYLQKQIPMAITNNKTMPVLIIDNKASLQGNNENGQDVYAMNMDNMPCLVPDSTFTSDMPGAETFRRRDFLNRP